RRPGASPVEVVQRRGRARHGARPDQRAGGRGRCKALRGVLPAGGSRSTEEIARGQCRFCRAHGEDRVMIKTTVCATGIAAALAAQVAWSQPKFGNPSPTAGSETSQKANAAADVAAYQPVEYANKNKRGPDLVVIPGEIKSNNALFRQRILPTNIA